MLSCCHQTTERCPISLHDCRPRCCLLSSQLLCRSAGTTDGIWSSTSTLFKVQTLWLLAAAWDLSSVLLHSPHRPQPRPEHWYPVIIIIIIMEAAHRNSVPNSFSSCPCIFVNFNLFAAVVNLPPFQPTINSPRLPTANSNIKALYYQLHWIFSAKMRNIYIRHYPGREQSKHWSPPDAVKD